MYIKRALGKRLIYQHHDHLRIEAYSDVGYVRDKGDRKSITEYCTYVGGNLVTLRSQKQRSFLVRVRKLSIKLWLIPLVKLYRT